MKKSLSIALILLISYINSQANEQKYILLLNSYYQGTPWVDDITKGADDILEIDKNNFIVYVENMDTKRHNSSEYYNSLANLYKNKYAHTKFDIILSSDNDALNFLKKYKNDIFGKDIPVSFCGVNNYTPALLDGYYNYTGVAELFSEAENVELILKLHPKAKEIYIINDYLLSARAVEETMKRNLKKYENKIKITYAPNQTIRELQNSIKNLSKDTVILMGAYYADKNKKYFTYDEMNKILLDISNVPVYCSLAYNISDGVIGGKVISGYYQGAMMAKLAIDILQGTNPKDIDVVTQAANKFIFSKKALDKFHIDIKQLPKDSKIINNDQSIYEEYSFTISLILIIVSIFLASIISLYYYQKKLPNEKAVVKLLIFGPIIFIPTIISILIYSILTNNEQIYKENIQSIITTDTKNQKNMLRNEVEQLAKLSHIFKNKKEQLFEYINTTRYGNNGYFFALDTEGNVLANGDNKDLIGKNVYNLKGEDNIYFTKEIITNALSNNIEFIKYKWPYPLTSKLSTKYTYSKFLPQYNIIIASGIYDEDINLISYKKITELNEKNKKQVLQILWISFTIIITFTILAIILSNMVRKIFEKYNNEIDKKNLDLEKLNLSLEDRIHEEVKKNQEKDSLIFQQSKMVSMGEMIGNIAHQWRQPLSVISTGVTGMKLKKEYSSLEDEDFFKTCDIINENAQYLSKTIDDFKNYIKNERTKVDFIIKENIDNLMKIVEGTIKNNNITPILDIDETLQINGYPNELIQCMMNIVNNAKDALKEIKDERFIFITVKANNNNVEIIFKDNANGIPENIISKIFEPYFTTKHQSQGTGLGLSMTYSMITKGMNGSIDVKNTSYLYKEKKYKGAQFTITLPLNIEGEII
jgi:signal transduction histidine kinase/ABC-type uncharacterized transport system substrate-binding protein